MKNNLIRFKKFVKRLWVNTCIWAKALAFEMKNTTKLKARAKILYLNHILPHWKVLLVCVALGVALVCVLARTAAPYEGKYEYIDLNGNRGIATDCYVTEFGLVCEQYYGKNTIQVHQYSQLD